MVVLVEWVSPDKKIKKVITKKGKGGTKPYESAECTIIIKQGNAELEQCLKETNLELGAKNNVIVGDNDTQFGRLLDIVIQMMCKGEVAEIYFYMQRRSVVFKMELVDFTSHGYIFEWDAKYKHTLALKHKDKGIQLFRDNCITDASQRFSKGLKILCSIPIDVQFIPESIDGVLLSDINDLKCNFYNNLASCFMKVKEYARVVELCEKVVVFDAENIKGLYKLGVAYMQLNNFERGVDVLGKLIKIEPDNKAALYKIKIAKAKISEEKNKYNQVVKNMFR